MFPDARLKVFLTADLPERARRRLEQEGRIGPSPEEIDAEVHRIAERDRIDTERQHAPLQPATDAIVIDTTQLGFDEQVDRIIELALARLAPGATVDAARDEYFAIEKRPADQRAGTIEFRGARATTFGETVLGDVRPVLALLTGGSRAAAPDRVPEHRQPARKWAWRGGNDPWTSTRIPRPAWWRPKGIVVATIASRRHRMLLENKCRDPWRRRSGWRRGGARVMRTHEPRLAAAAHEQRREDANRKPTH